MVVDLCRFQIRRKEKVTFLGTISDNLLHVGSVNIGLCAIISVLGKPIDPLRANWEEIIYSIEY